MKKYRVTIPIFASVTVEIEAENEEDAKENAYASIPSLCYRCSSEGIELGEYDEAVDIEAEEIE